MCHKYAETFTTIKRSTAERLQQHQLILPVGCKKLYLVIQPWCTETSRAMPSKPLKAIKRMFPSPSSWRIVKGDLVEVMVGKDKGKQGQVLQVVRDQRVPRVFVSGVNLRLRTQPKSTLGAIEMPGFKVRMESPIHYSNIMLVDPISKRPVRTRLIPTPTGLVRQSRGRRATRSFIPWPQKSKPPRESPSAGAMDTLPAAVDEVTYNPATDFTFSLPSAHRQLQQVRQQKEAAAARAKAWSGQNRGLLFTSKAAAARGNRNGPRVDSTTHLVAAGGFSRGFSTSAAAARPSCTPSREHTDLGQQAGWLTQLQRVRYSNTLILTGSAAHCSRLATLLSWCGLAAAPLVL